MEQISLLPDGELTRNTKHTDKEIAKRTKNKSKKSAVTLKGNGILDKIAIIRDNVDRALGKYKDKYICIRDIKTLHEYVDTCLADKRISLDTETTGLNVYKDKLVGISLDSKSNKCAYIPINHVEYNVIDDTFTRVKDQLTEEQVIPELKRLAEVEEVDMFNSFFDKRVIKHNLGIYFPCTWECSIAAKTLNENLPEKTYALKPLHSLWVLNGEEDEFKFGELFNDIGFDKVPIDCAYIYAAHDADDTTELSDFERQYIYYEPDQDFSARNGMNGASWCFFNIEMPCIEATIELEENGIGLDLDYQKELSKKYHEKAGEILNRFSEELTPYKVQLDELREYGIKLDNPININSPKQLAVLLYDVLKVGVIDRKTPRGTGEEILTKIKHPIVKTILEYRNVQKLIGTYIDKLPNCLEDDGKIHCQFNQYGARTGRFSSKDPNLQNIPSKNKDIRPMFVASPGHVMISMDYSQQEPSCLASFCKKMGYDALFDARFKGNDLYSEVASAIFNLPYADCVEHRIDGSINKEGKARRNDAKPVLLGILYDRGDDSVAEALNITLEQAKQLKQNLYKRFPEILIFEQESVRMAQDLGYVDTICGRKCRIPDMLLDEYDFKWDSDDGSEVPDDLCDKYWDKLHRKYAKKRDIFKEAKERDGVLIIDNGFKISEATRKCVNSRIQGSAADLTKKAMAEVLKNTRLKELGFKLLIQVHDELIGECPEESIKECTDLLAEVMSKAAEELIGMPFSCDAEVTHAWYGEPIKYKEEVEEPENFICFNCGEQAVVLDNIASFADYFDVGNGKVYECHCNKCHSEYVCRIPE